MTSVAPIVWSRVNWCTPAAADLEAAPLADYPFKPESKFKMVTYFNEPAVLVGYEEWYKGNDTEWVFFNETLFVVQSGRAEVTYWNPPNWEERGAYIAEPGMVLFYPRGARVWWKILSDEPFRRIVVDIPNPGFNIPMAGSSK